MPLVTVYITTYNRLELLKRAVESVRVQSYKNIEIIVADDGSNDGTQSWLNEQQAEDVLLAIINTTGESKGACVGRNKAINMAKGEFVTGLDDDDYFEPWRIQTFVDKWLDLQAQGSDFAGIFDSIVEHRKYGVVKCYDAPLVTFDALRKENAIGNQVFTSKENWLGINGFDEKMPALQDWDTWLRLSSKFGVLYNCLSYSYVQIHDHGGVRISEKPEAVVRFAFERLIDKVAPLSFSEKLALTYRLYSYGQVKPRFKELFILAIGFKLRRIAQVLKRTVLKNQ
ncbi:glycosyltransferase family 2 protein [Glaciecola petra]|uniref:Glycosyltransferase n=1 Tax=Glaciecola petra TaxID=3075602 RepID=A0ABU2ZTJ1_9ALTE|nr:glycosyltransferase [Aestuariibacter sp. P117]MDT0595952.1 glycosyltransferase [Aestuariibacter sp. P117]